LWIYIVQAWKFVAVHEMKKNILLLLLLKFIDGDFASLI
jgi:hypothetical protein